MPKGTQSIGTLTELSQLTDEQLSVRLKYFMNLRSDRATATKYSVRVGSMWLYSSDTDGLFEKLQRSIHKHKLSVGASDNVAISG